MTFETDGERAQFVAAANATVVPGPLESATTPAPPRIEAHLSDRTLKRLAALVVVAFAIQLAITRVGPTLIWAIVGVLLAIALDRPVSWVERRWQIPRLVIVVFGAILMAGMLAGLLSTTRIGLDRAGSIDDDIPAFVESLEELPLVGDRLAEQDLDRRVADLRRELPSLINRSPIAERSIGVAAGGLSAVFVGARPRSFHSSGDSTRQGRQGRNRFVRGRLGPRRSDQRHARRHRHNAHRRATTRRPRAVGLRLERSARHPTRGGGSCSAHRMVPRRLSLDSVEDVARGRSRAGSSLPLDNSCVQR